MHIFLILSILLVIELRVEADSHGNGCPSEFPDACRCRRQPYPHAESRKQFVVNCTNTRLKDSDALSFLPEQTEVLIFTGNFLTELDPNIFGFDLKFEKLNYIDLSNNHIQFIHGQTFHKVQNVETLILNFNDLEITDQFERHRIFSNFRSLKYLHLTDAFTDRYNASAYYILRLEDIFVESNLDKLERLHLEQNEIASIGTNTSIFCPLKSLQQLYLADNKLTDMDFHINCTENLNHIDMRYNSITRLSNSAMKRLDGFVSSGHPLSLNLLDNPLVCDCRSVDFLHWLSTSGIKMDYVEKYVCVDGCPIENIKKHIIDVDFVSCPGIRLNGYSAGTVGILSFLVVIMILTVVGLGVYHRKKLSSLMKPLVDDVTRKVGYKGLASEETPTEVNV